MIRPATLDDLDALVEVENRCFTTDRLSRRSFRHMLTKAHAATLVEVDEGGALRGYAMLLFHGATSLARLYSIAVDERFRGEGVGRALVVAAEERSREEECIVLRLEIRRDNEASIALFRSRGYRLFGRHPDYYEDHMEALRFEKTLLPHFRPDLAHVPYYRQTLEFTCGPSALLMAMKALDPATEMTRRNEIQLWRESTTIYMTSGHGGCGPHGLALAAHHRGFDVEIYLSEEGALFVDSVRSAEKKEVMALVQETFEEEVATAGITVHYRRLSVAEMREHFDRGGVLLVLISSYRIYREKFPHWVVVNGFNDRYVFVHDPLVETRMDKTETESINMPIPLKDFERMARYGKSGLRAALVLYRRGGG